MPAFRARQFFKRDIRSPADIVSSGIDAVTMILVLYALTQSFIWLNNTTQPCHVLQQFDSLPFDSTAPAQAGGAQNRGPIAGGGVDADREPLCRRLAGQIIAR